MQVEKPVPENQRKKQERDTKHAAALQKAREERRKAAAGKKAMWLEHGKKAHEAYLAEEKRLVDENRKANAEGKIFVKAQPKVALVVRVKGINKMTPKTKLVMRLLRLRQINNAVFLKINKATLNMLKKVEAYITFGVPNRKTVSQLVYGRGYGKMNGQRVKLNDNLQVEEHLGKYGVVCNEDIVHEVFNCGPNFKQVNNFLWPFKLNPPKGGYLDKRNTYLNHGDTGIRDGEINSFVRRMM